MSKPIYFERGIEVYNNGTILLIRCPKCHRENWALEVISGKCAWCNYDAHKDIEIIKRVNNNFNN